MRDAYEVIKSWLERFLRSRVSPPNVFRLSDDRTPRERERVCVCVCERERVRERYVERSHSQIA